MADIRLNPEEDALSLAVEETHEIESFEGHRLPRDDPRIASRPFCIRQSPEG